MSLELHVPDAVNLDALMSERGERSFGKALVKVTTEAKAVYIRTLLLSSRTLYEFSVDAALAASIIGIDTFHTQSPQQLQQGLSLPPLISLHSLKQKPLTDIHSLSPHPTDPSSFYLHFFSGSLSHRALHSFSKLKRILAPASSLSFIKSQLLTFATPELARTHQLLLSMLVSRDFQRVLEAPEGGVLPEPEYYQRHAFVMKGTKDRMLVLSNAWLYNVEVDYHPWRVKAIKWVISIQAVNRIGLGVREGGEAKEEEARGEGEEGREASAVLVIGFDVGRAQRMFDAHHRSYKAGKALAEKEWHFHFRCEEERKRFAQSMQKTFYENTGQHIRPQFVHL